MMNVQKDLLKFATLDRASFISSASWVRGLIIIGLNWLFGNSKLAIIKNLSQFFKHYFLRVFNTFFSLLFRLLRWCHKTPLAGYWYYK